MAEATVTQRNKKTLTGLFDRAEFAYSLFDSGEDMFGETTPSMEIALAAVTGLAASAKLQRSQRSIS